MLPEAFSSADYSRNAARAGDRQPCVVCGKPVTTARPAYVRVDTSNRLHAVSAELGEQDFGCFPIGASCLRQHPAVKPLVERF